jgi:hypothetical protein
MRTPTEFELQSRAGGHIRSVKAHQYYEKHKHLKGRKRGQVRTTGRKPSLNRQVSQTGKAHQIQKGARAKQRKELSDRIQSLSKKLHQLEALIRKKEHEAHSEDRKSKAKKERAAKEKDKPKSAAEKAKAARENKQFRDKHKQELKTKAKKAASKSSGTTHDKKVSRNKSEVADFRLKV